MIMRARRLQAGDTGRDFDFRTPWALPKNFYETIGENPAVLVFLRYQGCPVCQMDMARLKREIGLFARKEARVFVVLQSSVDTVASVTHEEDWPFVLVCDPEREIFEKYAVGAGGILNYLHPAGMAAAMKAIMQGYRHGTFEGRETQLPAAFVMNSKKIIRYAYYGVHIDDIPTPAILAAKLE